MLLQGTEAAFLRKRRRAAAAAAARAPAEGALQRATALSARVWAASHEKELGFIQKKRRRVFSEAILGRTILPGEASAAELAAAAEQQAEQARRDASRAAQHMRRDAVLHRSSARLPRWRGMVAYIAKDIDAPRLRAAAEQAGLTLASRAKATVHLVANPVKPGVRTLWAAVLSGGYLITAAALQPEGQRRGPVLKYTAAFDSGRRFWVTKAFSARHPGLSSVFWGAWRLGRSKWRRLPSKERLVELARASQRLKRPYEHILLCTAREKKEPHLARRV